MEGDVIVSVLYKVLGNFNPRPPWGGRLLVTVAFKFVTVRFQSTPSVGRATIGGANGGFFKKISIHALRGEGDREVSQHILLAGVFQSTPSVGRATILPYRQEQQKKYFNPRPPWGGRR